MSTERDGRRVSGALTEARTVHSRALSALRRLDYLRDADPASTEIRTALEGVVTLLDPFRRTGRGCPNCGAPGAGHPKRDDGSGRVPYYWPYSCSVPQ